MLHLLIQPHARRTKMVTYGTLSCEIVSESDNSKQLRVSLPQTVISTKVIPYDENRACVHERVPLPEGVDSSTYDENCQIENTYIVNFTQKCYNAIIKHDMYNALYAPAKVFNTDHNPRLFAIGGLQERIERSCQENLQTIEVDFEGDLKMVCHDTSDSSSQIAGFVKNVEQAFGIKILVPAPSNLQDVNLRRAPQPPRPPVSI